MTFAGVSRHVAVLESAGLIRREVRGREHWLSIRPDGLRQAERWIGEQTAFWSKRADALANASNANGVLHERRTGGGRHARDARASGSGVRRVARSGGARRVHVPVTRHARHDDRVDPRIGGKLTIVMGDPAGDVHITGEYVALERPRRLSFTWRHEGGVDSVVTITFEPHGEDETLMTIHHVQLPPHLVPGHEAGWTSIAEHLETRLKPRH